MRAAIHLLSVATSACLASSAAAQNLYWNLDDTFDGVANPDGPWSYGTLDPTYTIFTPAWTSQFQCESPAWLTTNYAQLWRNMCPGFVTGVAPGQLAMSPSPSGEPFVVRFVVPADLPGPSMTVHAVFLPGDSGTPLVAVRHDGQFNFLAPGAGEALVTFNPQAGDAIDFLVFGVASRGNTPVQLSVIAHIWCDPDINCDGNADQDDVNCMVNAIAGCEARTST